MIPTADRERLIQTLESKAWRYRIDIVEMITEAGSGHPGGSLSVIDIVSCLYHYKLRHRPADPSWDERDRLGLDPAGAGADAGADQLIQRDGAGATVGDRCAVAHGVRLGTIIGAAALQAESNQNSKDRDMERVHPVIIGATDGPDKGAGARSRIRVPWKRRLSFALDPNGFQCQTSIAPVES